MKITIPGDVAEWVRQVFSDCNRRTSQKLMEMPTTHEESLDFTFIEALSRHAAPIKFPSEWIVRLDTHYLGGRRHFFGWEIADIGILVVFRKAGKVVRSKIGFGRLFPNPTTFEAVSAPRTFHFTDASQYQALLAGDAQYAAIAQYEKKHHIPVFYFLHHPWRVPFSRVIPVTDARLPDGGFEVGCRVLPTSTVRTALDGKPKGYKSTFAELAAVSVTPPASSAEGPGWPVEEFIADLVLPCHSGYIAKSQRDAGLDAVFNRRGGPIAPAVAITFDAP